MNEQLEELTNDLIAVVWPALDAGLSRDAISCAVYNVLDSWTPAPTDATPALACPSTPDKGGV